MDLKADVRKVRSDTTQPTELVGKAEASSGKAQPFGGIRVDFDDYSNRSLLSYKGSVASTKSLCRICQSETGTMIRPCACDGTMGKIHENCLNEWVLHSRKECCEICKTDYAKSGNVFLPFREWRKPDMSSSNWIELSAVLGLVYSVFYICTLFTERQFFVRLLVNELPPRESDVARMILLLLVCSFLAGGIYDMVQKVNFYFRKQCKVHFINNEKEESSSAKNLSVGELNVGELKNCGTEYRQRGGGDSGAAEGELLDDDPSHVSDVVVVVSAATAADGHRQLSSASSSLVRYRVEETQDDTSSSGVVALSSVDTITAISPERVREPPQHQY